MPAKKGLTTHTQTVVPFVCDHWQEKEIDERITNTELRERKRVPSEFEETDSNAKDVQQSIKIGAMLRTVV